MLCDKNVNLIRAKQKNKKNRFTNHSKKKEELNKNHNDKEKLT